MSSKSSERRWLILALQIFGLYVALVVCATWFSPPAFTIVGRLMKDFQGNLVAGLIANAVFLILAVKLDEDTSVRIKRIEEAASLSEAVLKKREEDIDRERRITRFEQFIKVENYHNVRFPDLVREHYSLGLEYTIRPVRDSNSSPKVRSGEMYSYWIVEIQSPAFENVLKPKQLEQFYDSPIQVGSYYYCLFRNNDWHMSDDGGTMHRFRLSSKLGPVESGMSADQFMGYKADPEGMTKVIDLLILQDGKVWDGKESGGGDLYKVFRDSKGGLFLKINYSPLKSLYMTNKRDSVGKDSENWFLQIDHLYGFGNKTKMQKVMAVLQKNLEDQKVDVPRVHWSKLPSAR